MSAIAFFGSKYNRIESSLRIRDLFLIEFSNLIGNLSGNSIAGNPEDV